MLMPCNAILPPANNPAAAKIDLFYRKNITGCKSFFSVKIKRLSIPGKSAPAAAGRYYQYERPKIVHYPCFT
jgi:hypothetical protein